MGGNVFSGSGAIKKENIEPTLSRFYQELQRIFPGKAGKAMASAEFLGSTGKKDESGDIDLAVSGDVLKSISSWGLSKTEVTRLAEKFKARARTATKDQILRKAILTAVGQKIDTSSSRIKVDVKGAGNGVLFFQFPQFDRSGTFLEKSVQIDMNFGDLEWLMFSYHSNASKGNIKGLHRTQLMIALFTEKGYTFSHNRGIRNKETGKVAASTPKQAIDLLNQLYGFKITDGDLDSYDNLQEFLKNYLDKEILQRVWDTYLKVLDNTRCDIPADLENYWLDNQERLDLDGKFLPSSSKLYPFRNE